MFNIDLDYFPQSLLDIGANAGHFTSQFLARYPNVSAVCMEPNPHLTSHLKNLGFETYQVGASNVNQKRKFIINASDLKSTGNSFYKEVSVHFTRTEEIDVDVVRCDDFFQERTFDFIKIDTQGSDYDAVDGARELIKRCKYLLIEIPFFPLNEKSILADKIIPLIVSLGLKVDKFPEFHVNKPVHHRMMFAPDFEEPFVSHMDILWKNF